MEENEQSLIPVDHPLIATYMDNMSKQSLKDKIVKWDYAGEPTPYPAQSPKANPFKKSGKLFVDNPGSGSSNLCPNPAAESSPFGWSSAGKVEKNTDLDDPLHNSNLMSDFPSPGFDLSWSEHGHDVKSDLKGVAEALYAAQLNSAAVAGYGAYSPKFNSSGFAPTDPKFHPGGFVQTGVLLHNPSPSYETILSATDVSTLFAPQKDDTYLKVILHVAKNWSVREFVMITHEIPLTQVSRSSLQSEALLDEHLDHLMMVGRLKLEEKLANHMHLFTEVFWSLTGGLDASVDSVELISRDNLRSALLALVRPAQGLAGFSTPRLRWCARATVLPALDIGKQQ